MGMKKIAWTILSILLLGFVSVTTVQAEMIQWVLGGKQVYLVRKADNFLILYDRSGSMAEKYANTVMTKLQAERKILLEKNATLPDMDWQAGVYSFTPGSGVTLDAVIVHHPMQQYEKKMFSWHLIRMPLEPSGPTMLQQGLTSLKKTLADLHGKTVVFLFTDGQYSPVDMMDTPGAIAKQITAKHDVCFVVINTGKDYEGTATINSIASSSDCSYVLPFDQLLGNPEWMTNALFEVVSKRPQDTKQVIVGYEWKNILFDFDKSNIKPEYYSALAKVAAFMRQYPESRVVLEGHTDSIGTRDYNLKLSHRRASSVRKYLVTKEGINPDRITLSGFGFDNPVATNATATGRALNRRVQGIITNIK